MLAQSFINHRKRLTGHGCNVFSNPAFDNTLNVIPLALAAFKASASAFFCALKAASSSVSSALAFLGACREDERHFLSFLW
jgi:hypothetical protein